MSFSAIDISDGILADLGHILAASHKGAIVRVDQLPLSDALKDNKTENILEIALTSGDDYELCFTVPAVRRSEIDRLQGTGCKVVCIGTVTDTPGIQWLRPDNEPYTPHGNAYVHF